MIALVINDYFQFDTQTDSFCIILHANRYLQYNLTHKQIALIINNYFKFDTATGKLVSQRKQLCFCMYTYQHHLENLSYQTHAKRWALKSSCEGTFLTKWLSETMVTCGTLRVNICTSVQSCSEILVSCLMSFQLVS